MGHSPMRQRAQSETVGVILLVAVVLTLVVGAGAVLISDWYADTERDARVTVDSDLTATDLTLRHMGGNTLDPADVRVVIREVGMDLTLADTEFNGTAESFEAGSRWTYTFPSLLSGGVTVQVFQTETNTLLHEQTYDVGQEGFVLTVGEATGATTIENGETVPYTVTRTFERGPDENVSTAATVTELGGNNLTVDSSALTVTGVTEGTSTVEATLNGTSASVTVTVVNRPSLDVTVLNSPSKVERGENVTVNGTIENTGTGVASGATVDLTIVDDSGTTVFSDTETITLSPGQSQVVNFTDWRTGSEDVGSHTVALTTADDRNDTSLSVIEPDPSTILEINEGGDAIGEGESFDQHLTWENTDDETVTLVTKGDGTEPSRTEIEIDPGESVTPETLGFPESGILARVTDDPDANTVTAEIDEQ